MIPAIEQRIDNTVERTKRYASLFGGGLLVAYGLRRRSLGGCALALVGGDLLYRGAKGDGHLYDLVLPKQPEGALPYGSGVKVKKSVIVNKPVEHLYAFWRDFENLPCFMRHIESVEMRDDKRSHWKVKGPMGASLEWDAEIIAERENEMIGWRSLEGAEVDHAGSVRFEPVRGGTGTRVIVALQYNPLAGAAGAKIAQILGSDPRRQVREELRRFKQLMEAVEIPVLQKLLQKRAS